MKSKSTEFKLKFSALLLAFFIAETGFSHAPAQAEEQKMKYGSEASPLSESHDYFKNHFPPLFWKIIPYYVHQQNKWSCQVASSMMTLNAARAILKITPKLTAEQPLFYEEDFIEFMKKNKALVPFYNSFSKRGASLPELAEVLKITLKENRMDSVRVEISQFNADSELGAKEKHLHDLLATLETSDRHLIIANFNQGIYTGDANAGHYSPIAAYDSKNQKVLILDTDRQWYEPYWVSEKVFMNGMKTPDSSSRNNRGYLHMELAEPTP